MSDVYFYEVNIDESQRIFCGIRLYYLTSKLDAYL